jgi:hypothetical protein
MQLLKKPNKTEKIRLHRLRWLEFPPHPQKVLCMDLETTIFRGRPRNRWQDEVREDGRIFGGEEWRKKSI